MVLMLRAVSVAHCVCCALLDTLVAQAGWEMGFLPQAVSGLVWGQWLEKAPQKRKSINGYICVSQTRARDCWPRSL